MQPKSFKELGLQMPEEGFVGEKIAMTKILNKQIVVHKFKIDPSKHNEGNYMKMQISIDSNKRVVFTGGSILMDLIQKIDEKDFPFTTTIVEEDERYIFT